MPRDFYPAPAKRCGERWRRHRVRANPQANFGERAPQHRVRASPRSGRQHKAWGASPRIELKKTIEPAKRATARHCFGLSPASRARIFVTSDPGAGAPCFMLSRASRAMLSPASQAKNSRGRGRWVLGLGRDSGIARRVMRKSRPLLCSE
jgi:hypothetical protein